MKYNVVYLEDTNKEIKINTLTNKGKVINIIPTNYNILYITDLLLNNKPIPYEDDNTFLINELIPLIPHLCTKHNINVGDNCKWKQPTTNKWLDITIKENTDIKYLQEEHNGRGLIKVLGKISDNALWINETYTLTDDEICQVKIREVHEDNQYKRNENGEYLRNEKGHVIKEDIEESYKDWWSEDPYYHSHKLVHKWGWKDAPDEAEFEITYNIFEIKGQCGHFH